MVCACASGSGHVLSSILGSSLCLPVQAGQLCLAAGDVIGLYAHPDVGRAPVGVALLISGLGEEEP